jgi:hypothetical protein
MTNPNAAKGARWERDVRTFLAAVFGKLVRRPHQEGFKDVGDLHLGPFVLQCKDVSGLSLPGAIRDAEKQAGHAGEPFGVVAHKVRGKGAAEATVSMSLATFRSLAAELIDLRKAAHELEVIKGALNYPTASREDHRS